MNPSLPTAEPPEVKKYSGPQRAAIILLALGADKSGALWNEFSEDEIKELSAVMAQLGSVPPKAIEHLLVQFSSDLTSMTSYHGSYESTERLLASVLPPEKVREIMEDIRGPNGRTMWDKLGNVSEQVLASYLKHEYPQTVAVILHKLKPDHAARVLAEFSHEFAIDVVSRMLKMEVVQKDVLGHIEQTLRSEFMSNLARTNKRDPHEALAEVFNALDRSTEEALLERLEQRIPESAERIRALMFTFEDLARLTPTAIQVLLRAANRQKLALALKGAPQAVSDVFFTNMSERARKLLREDMNMLGPVRVRDVEEAQMALVMQAKRLADAGEIVLADNKAGDDEIIY